ncbi:D-alanyl-D-alanine carboxypeptidase [candidate division WWE3 bacterium]|uniref:D-alanyl-D-alanine carboxypeptidase n=1 Tax=candidate division WWE3 bacterium TaxID=2053526 RepID=A0A7X9E7B8_UNCKA|nr:D-alanyl-D-alanine carboxypeptidase [candidate division WWE3 bacterium]
MKNISRRKYTLFLLILMLLITVFIFGEGLFKKVFKDEFLVKEDLTEKNYYSTLLINTLSDSGSSPDFSILQSNWNPGEEYGTSNQPEISGESGIVVDINSGRILYEKNSTQRLKIASLTKIMTAVVALEHKNINDEIVVSLKASSIGENVMGISESEVYTLEELLYGLILNSGNDAAYAIAEGVAGNSDTFVKWMNMKAKELNLNDTYFTDPCGLNDETYSTSVDLVKLSRYAMQKEEFRKIVSTVSMELPYSEKHKYIYLENQTNLLTTYPGVAGIKTGYTEEAGYCLVSYTKNNNIELIGAVLNSENRKFDMIFMLDHSYSTLGVVIEHPLLQFY